MLEITTSQVVEPMIQYFRFFQSTKWESLLPLMVHCDVPQPAREALIFDTMYVN